MHTAHPGQTTPVPPASDTICSRPSLEEIHTSNGYHQKEDGKGEMELEQGQIRTERSAASQHGEAERVQEGAAQECGDTWREREDSGKTPQIHGGLWDWGVCLWTRLGEPWAKRIWGAFKRGGPGGLRGFLRGMWHSFLRRGKSGTSVPRKQGGVWSIANVPISTSSGLPLFAYY